MPDLPGRAGDRGGDRRGPDRGFGGEGGERKERFPEGDGKVRDFGNWERKGPLPSVPQPERAPREGGRPRTNDGPRPEGFRDRKQSPAAWGERGQDSQEGSRPPRREFQERPAVERAPTAAEQDNQWRTKMRPDAPPAKSPVPSRDGSEAPSSPAPGATPTLAGRPKLNLAKRTVTDVPDLPSPSLGGESKASPFGAARPIDTAAKEREIEEKKQNAIREKKEAEDKAREEKREAAKAAKAAEAESASADGDKEVPEKSESEDAPVEETIETEDANGVVTDDKAVKPKEIVRDARPKPSDTGAWRRTTTGPPPARDARDARDDAPRGPRGGRGGGRGRGEGRGGRHYDERPQGQRQNTGGPAPAAAPQSPAAEEPNALEEDGWSTVAKPTKKNTRGGSRAIAS